MVLTFKPKKQQIHVPGYGVVQKEDFSQEHFDILIKRAGTSKEKQDAFIKQYFVVDSYGDQPLFEESEIKDLKESRKSKAAQEKAKKEEAQLLAEIEAEEKAKKDLKPEEAIAGE